VLLIYEIGGFDTRSTLFSPQNTFILLGFISVHTNWSRHNFKIAAAR
jgi:hypothetical protein